MKKTEKKNTTPRYREDIPFYSISEISTIGNKTGSWRYLKPMVETKRSPCEAECPLAIPISDYMFKITNGELEKAAELVLYENPIPSVCGRVCIHPCESKCNREFLDRSVSIHMVERYVGDNANTTLSKIDKSNKKIAVVGAGPAGLSAAYYLLLLGYKVTIFESSDELGGILHYIIPEYRLPKEDLKKSIKKIIDLGPEIKTGKTLGQNLSFDELEKFDAVFMGIGAWKGRKIDENRTDFDDVELGLDILNHLGKGKNDKIGKNVMIIGGGNTAIDVARSVLRIGNKPMILYRREMEEMPAFSQEIKEAIREGIEIKTSVVLKEIIRSENSVVGVKCVKVKFDKSSKEKRNDFTEIEDSEFFLETDQVISAIGETPDTSIMKNDIDIKWGKVTVDEFGRTSIPKYFAGGDLIPQPHLVVNALASGKKAAISIDATMKEFDLEKVHSHITVVKNGVSFQHYLNLRKHLIEGSEYESDDLNVLCDPEKINHEYFPEMEKAKEKKLSIDERINSFSEVHLGYEKESAEYEASRCFNCGRCIECDNCVIFCPDVSIKQVPEKSQVGVNYDFCKGCGLCSEECPRGVIEMKKEVIK